MKKKKEIIKEKKKKTRENSAPRLPGKQSTVRKPRTSARTTSDGTCETEANRKKKKERERKTPP